MEFVKYPSTCQLIHKKADFLAYSFSASCEKKPLCIPAEHQDYDPLRQLFLPALRREAVHTAPLRRSATCVQDIPYVNDTVTHKITIFSSAAIGDRLSELRQSTDPRRQNALGDELEKSRSSIANQWQCL